MEQGQIDSPTYGGTGGQVASKREQVIEVAVFLFLIVPSLALSFFAVKQGSIGFALTAVATILRDLSLLALIAFFLWRNREPIVQVGWTPRRVWRDIILGVALFVPTFYGTGLLDQFLTSIGFSSPSTPLPSLEPTRTLAEMLLALVLVAVVAVTEETIFRGYLMLRFRTVTASPVWSLLLAAVVFSLGHGYEGTAGVVTVGTMGLIFGLIYNWRKSLVAPMTMHFLQDFLSIVLLPLLAGR